ncbi:hypothetical protein AZI85_01580 [Bdellovibrio bacteriovorus]|uniref:DoxX family protein n=1 Tax=Bdellovibrio bacteriovorus TaxID=959 RepID=A0A150WW21_BDEBC|nr:DoxX family protein [Bdellovibrio bacteriovorus]KYG70654.1 hypothetical protein AZI85_01580 [Bdellovibrio bacteriovorus]
MSIFLWVLQFALAFHTLIGAVWKFSNTAEATMPTLGAIPQGVWMGLAVLEILLGLCLILPLFKRDMAKAAPIAAGLIAAEMLVFCALHLFSGSTEYGPMIYWLVVAALCGFIAYGRLVLKPIK